MPNFLTNQFYDLSPLIEITTRTPGVVESLDLFDINYDRSTTVRAQRIVDEQVLIEARQRQGERNLITGNQPSEVAFIVPFFPVDANIKAVDVQNFTNLLDLGEDTPATVQQAVTRKLNQIRNAESVTKERIFTEAVMGRSYAGVTAANANEHYDYYQTWGVTQEVVDVAFSSTTVNPTDTIESEIRGFIIDNKGTGTAVTDIVALCGRQYFQALVSNSFTRAAYTGIAGQSPLRDRIGGNSDARSWFFNGVLYVEDPYGTIPTNEAYFFPRGIPNMFQAFYAPADAISDANEVAQDFYMYMIQDHRTAHIETEFSLLAVNTRPELVVRSTMS